MSYVMECNFYDIFGLVTSGKYKSRINLQDEDKYYPKNTIFNYDDKLFKSFICFFEKKSLILECIKEQKFDSIYKIRFKFNDTERYPQFFNTSKEKNIFRFMKEKRALDAYLKGSFRINCAYEFAKDIHTFARKDNEHIQKENLGNCIVINEFGENLKTFNANKKTYQLNINNYILCFSYEYDNNLFTEFNADLCLVITDVIEFERRLSNAIKNYSLISSRIYYNKIIHPLGILFNKDSSYKIQKEYRFFWEDFNNPEIVTIADLENLTYKKNTFIDISIGSLEDISFLINKEGLKIVYEENK